MARTMQLLRKDDATAAQRHGHGLCRARGPESGTPPESAAPCRTQAQNAQPSWSPQRRRHLAGPKSGIVESTQPRRSNVNWLPGKYCLTGARRSLGQAPGATGMSGPSASSPTCPEGQFTDNCYETAMLFDGLHPPLAVRFLQQARRTVSRVCGTPGHSAMSAVRPSLGMGAESGDLRVRQTVCRHGSCRPNSAFRAKSAKNRVTLGDQRPA
jgi:hypothetical protein